MPVAMVVEHGRTDSWKLSMSKISPNARLWFEWGCVACACRKKSSPARNRGSSSVPFLAHESVSSCVRCALLCGFGVLGCVLTRNREYQFDTRGPYCEM